MGRKPRRGQSRVEQPDTVVPPRNGESVAEGSPDATDDGSAAVSLRPENSRPPRRRPRFLALAVVVFVTWSCYLAYIAWTAWHQT
ncbi:MAG: hypothetical protein AB7F89_03325 [Pirellulaceae bacterium]